jgi:hypothetical protein
MEQKKMQCLVLGAVQDRSCSITEILILLKKPVKGENEVQLVNALIGSLSFLLTANYIRIFERNDLTGEETSLDNLEVNVELIVGYTDDCKAADDEGVNYKIAMTEDGMDFYARRCKAHKYIDDGTMK